ncbi:MAG: RES family NAD+ phosphorylase [Saprospiraceae bacterium]|nr:RES family NAD+ phosphorylase [Saprospiraceae bacterium]
MIVYRIDRIKRKDQLLSGEGAKLYGGRWNSKGIAALYTANSRSLAILEMLVHLDKREQIPEDRILVEIQVPDKLPVKRMTEKRLPTDWKNSPAPRALSAYFTTVVQEQKYIGLAVPSVIVPQEYNIVINLKHPENSKIKVKHWAPLKMDQRFR